MENRQMGDSRILIVDDNLPDIALIDHILRRAGYTKLRSTADAREAVPLFIDFEPDLAIVDLAMPYVDGYALLTHFGSLIPSGSYLPILVLTADVSKEAKQKALKLGAKDFITKPFENAEVLLRVNNLLHTRWLYVQIQEQNQLLDKRVRARTHELEESRLELLLRLAAAAEYRDDTTGSHTRRVGRTSALLAQTLGLPDSETRLIQLTAPLHDVGKIGMADHILLKPGKLTAEEFETVKAHVLIGAGILSGSRSPLLQMAETIALYHHERWDGSGYCSGLAAESIPLPARIVAVADAFDALTHERPYKRAWPEAAAMAEIRRQEGRYYDPKVVDALQKLISSDQIGSWETVDCGMPSEPTGAHVPASSWL
jgi:putative two-component system response regulator